METRDEPLLWARLGSGTLPYEESYWTTRRTAVGESTINFPRQLSLSDEASSQAPSEMPDRSSVLSCALNIVSTCIGTGLLALPFAFASAGTPLSCFLLVFFAACSAFSSYLLCQCCEWASCESYEEITVAAFGRAGSVGLEIVVIWLLFGAMTSLLVVCGDSLYAAFISSGFWHEGLLSSRPSALPFLSISDRTVLILLDVVCVAMPLSFLDTPKSLRYSNAVAVSLTLLVVLLLLLRGALSGLAAPVAESEAPPRPEQKPSVPAWGTAIRAVPIIMLSLGCQVQVPCVYATLEHRSLGRMAGVLGMSSAFCVALYGAIATAGLAALAALSQSDAVPGNILRGFPAQDVSANAMRVVMAGAVTLVYPMLCLPCRSMIDHLVFDSGAAVKPEPGQARLVALRRFAETLVILAATVLFATVDHDLASVFGLTGATSGALVCYLLPPACYLQLRRSETVSATERASTMICATTSAVFLVVMLPLCAVVALRTWEAWLQSR